MDIKPVELLFVWGSGLIDDTIEAVTHGPSHVAMFKDEITVIEAQAGRTVGEAALSFYLDRKCRIEVWTDPELTDEQRQSMIEYAKKLYGIPYDYILIPLEFLHFKALLPLDWYKENHHRICSSLIYNIADHAGRRWAYGPNCAPVDLMNFGTLQKKSDLPSKAVS